ncbi:MAG: two-component system sensor histidine kinase PilS (NtrC family) [Rhodothermales bacterium]|jgi:two-component system sensor histidine kinase PilS (NtrC family)
MSQVQKINAYPLTASLTKRVLTYLGFFRLFISTALAFAYLFDALVLAQNVNNSTLAGTTLISYIVLAAYLFVETKFKRSNILYVAHASLFVDTLFLTFLLFIFGGLESGLGVLLVFVCATAAILLPLRTALFLASLASLAVIGESVLGGMLRTGEAENLVRSGLYGLTNFVTTILAHILAYWARDYRLIAEKHQQSLSRLEQINELIIRRMRNGVLAVDHDGEIRLMNESAWFHLGSPPALERALPDVSPELYDAMIHWKNRTAVDSAAITLKASQAQVVPKFVALPSDRDISTLIFLEDNDVVAQRAIELSANSLAKLSGSIAHEIRNPLSAVSHAAQLLAESDKIPKSEIRLITIIQNQSRRMNGIIENILQLSRREKSRPDLFELKVWLLELLDEFLGAFPDLDLVSDIATENQELMIMFDRSQLHQIIWKLMENATDHAGKEGVNPKIKLKLSQIEKAGYCVISVEDNGQGIPEDQIGSIFEPFFTTRRQGSGLGLYVARQLCEANQAELTVDSIVDRGTRFHVRLETVRSRAETKTKDGSQGE